MLKAENIYIELSGIEVLRNVNLEIEKGSLYGLVGRNGAGKTTTFKTIVGFLKPKRGRVVIDGRDITGLSVDKRVLNGIGYVPEDMRIFPWLTARENIDISITISGNLDKSDDIYDMIYTIFPEVKRFLDRKGYYLSGGEKKMIAIARALALKPRYMLVDEAFEGLAPIVVDRFRKAISEIKDLGIGIVIAESNIKLTTRIVEHLYVIERGEIIYDGDPNNIYKDKKVMSIISG